MSVLTLTHGVDTSDATAAAGDILNGKTAYVDGEKVTGTILSHAGGIQTPTTTTHMGVPAGRYLTGNVLILGDPNLIPENIKSGVSIFGVEGQLEAGLDMELHELTVVNNIDSDDSAPAPEIYRYIYYTNSSGENVALVKPGETIILEVGSIFVVADTDKFRFIPTSPKLSRPLNVSCYQIKGAATLTITS